MVKPSLDDGLQTISENTKTSDDVISNSTHSALNHSANMHTGHHHSHRHGGSGAITTSKHSGHNHHDHDSEPSISYVPKKKKIKEEDFYLSEPSSLAPLEIAMDFLEKRGAELSVYSIDSKTLKVSDQILSRNSGVTHLYFQQYHNGLPIGMCQ